jgi:hypothetical protein
MRVLTFAAAALLAASAAPALASTTNGINETGRSPGAPLDRGPYTDSDRAYSGGGLVLEGAPGYAAPLPQQTAPAGSMRPEGGRSMAQDMPKPMPAPMPMR